MKRAILLLLTLVTLKVIGQDNTIIQDGYNKFYHPNGKIASEGLMREGKPDGYWKTFNDKGILIAEGNRKNFELDSIWNFYNDSAKLVLQISYLEGKKNGIRRTFRDNEVLEEHFVDDVKNGQTVLFYADGSVKRSVNFINGFEEGVAREFASDGTIISLTEYRRGVVIDRENINRVDKNGLKQGRWKFFFDDGKLKLEGTFRDNKRNGYFKEYDDKGMLVDIAKYVNDERQEEAPELVKLEVKTDYFPNGKPKTVVSYKDGLPEGIRRDYDTAGRVVASYTFSKGRIITEGIIDDEGIRDGEWKEFYEGGQLRAEGVYNLGKRVGKWMFYHENATVEQEGNYNSQGNAEGLWKWYYDDGSLLREENYRNGALDGLYTEYNEAGRIVVQGEFIDGLEEGFWKYEYGDIREEGTYKGGKRNGEWKTYYDNGQLYFVGSFIDDNPNGRHTWFWPDGKRKDQGDFIMGLRNGDWIQFDSQGAVFLVIAYQNGIERKYDGVRIKPEYDE